MKGHNKKRNVGLLFEFLVRNIAASLVEGNEAESNRAVDLLKNYFKPGTELYREYRLFNALMKTTASSPFVAASIMAEAKQAVRTLDESKLEKEKSLLIRKINHTLGDSDFFNRQISEYRTFATIGTLFTNWRQPAGTDLVQSSEYENKLMEWLTTPKAEARDLDSFKNESVDKLVVKLMTEKINQKYKKKLSPQQHEIIQAYVFANEASSISLIDTLNEIRVETMKLTEKYLAESKDTGAFPVLKQVRENILAHPVVVLDDKTIETYLKVAQLKDELAAE